MEPTPRGDEVPALFRSILLLVDELEQSDRREEVVRIRDQAVAAYGTAWDEHSLRRLERLEARLRRARDAAPRRPKRWFGLP